MADDYTKQTWVDGPGGGTPLSATRLNHMEDGIDVAEAQADAAAAAADLALVPSELIAGANVTLDKVTTPGSVIINASGGSASKGATFVVGASDATGTWGANYTCDGTADEVQINTAIAACAATGGKVILSDGLFTIAAPILMKTGVTLVGQGRAATRIKVASGFVGNAMIALNDVNVHLTAVRDLYLDGNSKTLNASSQTINGVWYNNSAGSFTGTPSSSPDPVHTVESLYIRDVSGCGVNLSGVAEPDDATTTSGNTRESRFINVFVFGSGRYGWFCISPDSFFVACTGAATATNYDAWLIRSSNNRYVACKGYYAGRDGFRVLGTRHEFSACEAQDAGRHGWSLEGYWNTFSACASDSSGRLKASYSGVGDGVYLSYAKYCRGDFAIYDRDETPASNTRHGVNFGGNNNRSSWTFAIDEANFEGSAYTGTYTETAKMELVAKTAGTTLWNEVAWTTGSGSGSLPSTAPANGMVLGVLDRTADPVTTAWMEVEAEVRIPARITGSSAVANGNTTTAVVTIPATAAAGDIAYAHVNWNTAQTITTDLGGSWTLVDSLTDSTYGARLYKVTVTATGTYAPGSTHTITFNGVNKATAACVTVLGTQDTYGHQSETGTDTARETLALTAAGNDSLVIDFAGCKGSSPVGVTAPGTRTLLTSASGTGGSATEVGVGWAPVTAAGTVASVSYTSQSVADGGTISVIVKPLVVQTYP